MMKMPLTLSKRMSDDYHHAADDVTAHADAIIARDIQRARCAMRRYVDVYRDATSASDMAARLRDVRWQRQRCAARKRCR